MLTWGKTPGSSHFSVLQATESWAEPGNEERQHNHMIVTII